MIEKISAWAVTSAQVTIEARSLFITTSFGRAKPSIRIAPPARAAAIATSSSSAGVGAFTNPPGQVQPGSDRPSQPRQ